MRARITRLRRPTFANVAVALLAFVVLAGGSAVAMKASITSRDIVNGGVHSKDIASKAATLAKIGPLPAVSLDDSEIANPDNQCIEPLVPGDHHDFAVPFNHARFDTAGMFDGHTCPKPATGSATRVRAPVDGIYLVSAELKLYPTDVEVAGNRNLRIVRFPAGSSDYEPITGADEDLSRSGTAFSLHASGLVKLKRGDRVGLIAHQNTNSSLSVGAAQLEAAWEAPS